MPSTEVADAPVDAPVDAPAARAERDGRRTDTRQRIVEAAMQMFSAQGYTRTTVAEIERAVGLRPGGGGLYRHFASKEDVLLEAGRAYTDRVRALRAELAERRVAAPVGGVAADLRALVTSLASFLTDEGPMIQLGLDAGGLPDAVRREIGDAWDEGYGMVIDLFCHHGVAEQEATVLAVSALGGLDHYFTHLGVWRRPPAGVAPAAFLDAWVEQWSATVSGPGVDAGLS